MALNILMELKLCDLSFIVNEHYICIKVYDANITISLCGKKEKNNKTTLPAEIVMPVRKKWPGTT